MYTFSIHVCMCVYVRNVRMYVRIGPFKCYVTQMVVSHFSEKKRYEGVRLNIIIVTRGWVGVEFPGKKHYVTLQRPLRSHARTHTVCHHYNAPR